MANIPVPDHTGTQNVNGYGANDVWWSMPLTISKPQPAPNLAVVADGYITPDALPDQMVAVGPQDVTYIDLWTSYTPEGFPAVGWLPGTFQHTAGAMPRGA